MLLTSHCCLFCSHVLQTTTWQDPRKSHSPNSLGSPQQPGSPASGTQTPPGPVDVTKLPVPPGWERAYTAEGEMYFINHVERTTSWFHPSLRAWQLFSSIHQQIGLVFSLPSSHNRGPFGFTAVMMSSCAAHCLLVMLIE